MNCECFYIVKEGTIEAARKMAAEIKMTADKNGMELNPFCISKVIKGFRATGDYDNMGREFPVAAGRILVFVEGKLHSMEDIRPRGGKRGFPVWETVGRYDDHVEDVVKLDDEEDTEEAHEVTVKKSQFQDLFDRTYRNCQFYLRQGDEYSLANEIGVLRGIVYCMDEIGEEPENIKQFNEMIDKQQELKAKDRA